MPVQLLRAHPEPVGFTAGATARTPCLLCRVRRLSLQRAIKFPAWSDAHPRLHSGRRLRFCRQEDVQSEVARFTSPVRCLLRPWLPDYAVALFHSSDLAGWLRRTRRLGLGTARRRRPPDAPVRAAAMPDWMRVE